MGRKEITTKRRFNESNRIIRKYWNYILIRMADGV